MKTAILAIATALFRSSFFYSTLKKHCIRDFIEVYVNAPLAVCEKRDVKGLYKKVRSGEIKNLTGIDELYEAPLHREVECKTDCETLDKSVTKVLAKVKELGYC